jgi:3-dehydroquinate synthase
LARKQKTPVPSGSSAATGEARSVKVRLGGRSYVIRIAEGILDEVGPALRDAVDPTSAIVVTDTNVRALYADRVERSLASAGIASATLEIKPGEPSKCSAELVRLWDAMLARGLDRKGAVVALGGGVVGDIAGFAAATILRGVAFLQVPTTLLAQVDSSVGGKTGIDLGAGKNLAGAFWQPVGVLADPTTLRTLAPRELKCGLAEVVKTGVIRSKPLFDLCVKRAEAMLRCDPEALGEAVRRSCAVKAQVVGRDERDTSGERAVLNFGHTVGHAVESAAGLGTVLHGEAVSIGMVAAGRIAVRMGLWEEDAQEALERILARFELPVDLGGLDLDVDEVTGRLKSDKKAVGGAVYFVLPSKIGRADLHPEPVAEELVREVVMELADVG